MPEDTILVTHCGARFGYNVVQSLLGAGYRVFAAAPRVPTMCAWMDGLAGEVEIPDAFLDTEGYVAAVNAAAERHGPLLFLPTHEDIFVAAEQRAAFDEAVTLIAPDLSPLLAVHDKYNLFRLAQDERITTPETRLLSDLQDVEQALTEWRCPIILKPRFGEGSNGIHKVQDAAALQKKAALITELSGQDYLLQKFAPGVGVGVGCLMSGGRLVAASQHIRLREVPISGGTSTARATFDRPELVEVSASILQKAGLNGIAMLEFRFDQKTDGFKLLDANPRYWGSLANHIRSGVDFPALHVASFTQQQPTPGPPIVPSRSVETRWILGEIRAAVELLAAGRFADAGSIFRRPADCEVVFEEFSSGSLKPFLIQLRTYALRGLSSRRGNDINAVKRTYFSQLFKRVDFTEIEQT